MPLAAGAAPADATWQVMLRQRALMASPGTAVAAAGPQPCAHRYARGAGAQCPGLVDPDGSHEALCNVGGGPSVRHNRVREWLAERLRDAFGGTTRMEVPHPHAGGRGMGRMDVKHDGAAGHLDVDVTVVSVRTADPAEALRRRTAPERALRAGVADKLRAYGPGVLAFAVDDTGAVSAGAMRLLHRMAFAVAGEAEGPLELTRSRAALQLIVLQATAAMAQSAAGAPRTA